MLHIVNDEFVFRVKIDISNTHHMLYIQCHGVYSQAKYFPAKN